MNKKPNNGFSAFHTLSGPLVIPLTNDYSFRALMQKNKNVLKGLICSLLHMKSDEIISIEILNPIVLGEAIKDKIFILDILVKLNNQSVLNLELQVINQHNWTDRSLVYLCRAFDRLNRGEDYGACSPAFQIGILDFTLFPDAPELFSTYKLQNVRTGKLYSDKFTIHVLDLNQTELATEEDKEYEIDYWAKLFKARTWEELRMLAEKDKVFEEAAHTIYDMSQDEAIRMQIQAREDFYRDQRAYQQWVDEQMKVRDEALEEARMDLDSTKALLSETKADLDSTKADLDTAKEALQSSEKENARLKQLLVENGIRVES